MHYIKPKIKLTPLETTLFAMTQAAAGHAVAVNALWMLIKHDYWADTTRSQIDTALEKLEKIGLVEITE